MTKKTGPAETPEQQEVEIVVITKDLMQAIATQLQSYPLTYPASTERDRVLNQLLQSRPMQMRVGPDGTLTPASPEDTKKNG